MTRPARVSHTAPVTDTGSENGTATPSSVETGNSANETPAWFRAYVEMADKRFEGLSARLPKPDPSKRTEPANGAATAETSTKPSGVTQSELDASMRLGELRQSLPEEVRGDLDELRGEGLTLDQLLKVGERMARRAANALSDSEPANGSPRGLAANAAQSTAPHYPTSIPELMQVKESNPEAFRLLMRDPAFDPSLLPRS